MKQLTDHVYLDPAGNVTWRGPFRTPADAGHWRFFAVRELAEALEAAQEQLAALQAGDDLHCGGPLA